jgi:hypothetical protein
MQHFFQLDHRYLLAAQYMQPLPSWRTVGFQTFVTGILRSMDADQTG